MAQPAECLNGHAPDAGMASRPAGESGAVARVSTVSHVTPHEVFELVCNGWRYAEWVVGTKRIRAVDPDWPAVGSRFHHAVGLGPITFRDVSEVCEIDHDRRIVLLVRVWPAGRGRVTIDVEPVPEGCRITLDEVPVEGPAAKLDGPVLEAAAYLRNKESLRRLKRAVEEARIAGRE